MLSIIIPARTEKFLNHTIRDVLKKATGEIEVFPVLDGYTWHQLVEYEKVDDPRVKYIWLPLPDNFDRHKRQAINTGVSIANGEYICWMDAHCVVAPGFDEQLIKDCKEDNWVMVPRRWRLNPGKWDKEGWEGRPPIDYEYCMWQYLTKKKRLSGYRWDVKSRERANIPIDDIFTAQGSFFFMKKSWFEKMGFMHLDGYTGWGQEGEEVCLTTIKNGGRAVVDKNTWYAHMHKGQMHGRMYKWTNVEPSYGYSFNYWVHENRDFFVKLINRFMPIPNFSNDWEKRLYGN
jgi:glycosyltransferase involved in cell wall biosynthesis